MWKPENWDAIEIAKTVEGRSFKGVSQLDVDLIEAGAEAMHKADVDFIMRLGNDIVFLIKSRLKKEKYEAFFIHSA